MKRLLLIVVLALLPTAALADCAWVLWGEAVSLTAGVGNLWEVFNAFETREACMAGALSAQKEAVKLMGTKDKQTFLRAICLPDTVDPRGKEERGG